MRPSGASGASGRAGRNRYELQAAAYRKKRIVRAKANQAQLAKNRTQQRNAKIATSNTLTAKAETQLDAKQVDQAIASYREALKNNPKNEDAASGLSDALVAKGTDVAGDTSNPAAIGPRASPMS